MKIFLTILLNVLFLCAWSQNTVPVAGFTYKLGTEEPSANWKLNTFDDSGWDVGNTNVNDSSYAIGYGDGVEATVIDTTVSVYIRMPFSYDSLSLNEGLMLLADFDDGFVAYLNGVEVVRVNLGHTGEEIPHDRLADRSHEARRKRLVYGPNNFPYVFNRDSVDTALVEGTNILAVQVHNDSARGTDLSFYGRLLEMSYSRYNPYQMGKTTVSLDSTHLPIVVIETDEYGITTHKKDFPATMGIVHHAAGMNRPTDSFNVYDGNITIKTRGQSSLHWPKASFGIETKDDEMNDTNVVLLHLPKEEDWVLFGPFSDRSLIRNALIMEIGRRTGHYTPRSFFCELMYNGEYCGVYQIVEKIKRDKNRLDIKKLNSDEIYGQDLTGGYILKYDKRDPYGTDQEGKEIIVYPKADDIAPEQVEYITSYIAQYKESLKDKNLFDSEKGYRNYVDINSFVDFTIVNELCRNPDAYRFSTYFYKDRDDINPRLQYGPLWDFDLAIGNSIFQDGNLTYGWQFNLSTNTRLEHRKIFKDTVAVQAFQQRWKELRESTLSTDSLNEIIDSLVALLGNRVAKNYEVWPMENKNLEIFGFEYTFAINYEAEIPQLKSWLNSRMVWIDQNIDNIYYPYNYVNTSLENNLRGEVSIFPTVCSDRVNCLSTADSEIHFVLSSVYGTALGSVETVTSGEQVTLDMRSYPNGIYFVNAYANGSLVCATKIIKQ